MERTAQITIRGFRCSLGPLQVLLDGAEAASVADCQPITLRVTPGTHSLSVKNVLYSSRVETLTLEPGETAEFECLNTFWKDWPRRKWFLWWSVDWIWGDQDRPWLIRVNAHPKADHGHEEAEVIR